MSKCRAFTTQRRASLRQRIRILFRKIIRIRITGGFADRYRVEQIRALLGAKAKLNVDDMLAAQKDVYSSYDLFLAKQAIAAYDKAGNPRRISY